MRAHCSALIPSIWPSLPGLDLPHERHGVVDPVGTLGLVGTRAHHRQVAGRIGGVVEDTVHRSVRQLAGAVRQHLAGDGADRHVDPAQERRVDLRTLERTPSQPGVEPQLQPLAGKAVGLQRAPAEAVATRPPSPGVRGSAGAGARPAARCRSGRSPSPARSRCRAGALRRSREFAEDLKCVERHGGVPVGGGHHAQP